MRKLCSLAIVAAMISLGIPSAAFAAPARVRARQQNPPQFGTITGTAKDAKGQALSNYTVRARDAAGNIVGQSVSNSVGTYSITGLAPGNYIIEVVNAAGQVVGLSSTVAVTAGAVVTVTITATAAGTVGAAAAGGGGSIFRPGANPNAPGVCGAAPSGNGWAAGGAGD